MAAKYIDRFTANRDSFSRQVRERTETGLSLPQSLESMVARRLQDKGFRCIGIEVAGDDGMAWAAHVADTVIADSAPQVTRLRLRGDSPSAEHPELEQIMAPRKIAAIAKKSGLTRSRRLSGWRLYAVAAGAIIAGAGASLLDALFTASLTLPVVIGFVVAAALLVCGQLLTEKIHSGSESSALDRAAEDIAAAAKKLDDNFLQFIDKLAAELSRPSEFRCLIVDDFTGLDIVTRMVLQRYLERHANIDYRELWILFFSSDDNLLAISHADNKGKSGRDGYGYRRVVLYLMEHLSTAKAKTLADALDVPWRGYHTVGAIVQGDSSTALRDFFRQQYQLRAKLVEGVTNGDILNFFYILAINAMPSLNRGLRTSDIRKNFSSQNRLSWMLTWLMNGRHLSSNEVGHYLRLVADRYLPQAGSAADDEGSDRLRKIIVAPEAAQSLEASWQDLALPNPSIVHLFWALYWADRELQGETTIAVLPLICAHLLESPTPASLKSQIADPGTGFGAFTDQMYDTVLGVIRACLRLCVLGSVPKLLSYALRLVEDDRKDVEHRRRSRLRPLAWQAYKLLGDEKLFAVILEVEQVSPVSHSDWAADEHDLVYLYLQSMQGGDSETRQIVRSDVSGATAVQQAGGYARARAGWLVASIAPFLRSGMSSLLEVAKDAQSQLPDVVSTSIDSLQAAADGEWQTTDVLDLLLGLWDTALISDERRARITGWQLTQTRASRYVDLLTQAYWLGADLSKKRESIDSSPQTLDFVLDCLVRELLTVVVAAGVLMLLRWPNAIWSEAVPRDDVVQAVRESGSLLGMSERLLIQPGGVADTELIEEVSRHMTLLTMLWRGLNFEQQASFTAIRLGQFHAVLTGHDMQPAEAAVDLLAAEIKQADHVGLLANLAMAESAKVSDQLEALWLSRACMAAIRGGFADRLAAELSVAAIEVGHAYGIDFSECVAFVLRPWADGTKPRLATLLSDISESEIEDFVRAILNILRDAPSERVDVVSDLVKARIAEVEDPAIEKSVTGLFGIFELGRKIAMKKPVDVAFELDKWNDLKGIPEYAYLLYLLVPLATRDVHDRLIAESVAVLTDVEVYRRNTGYVLLAERLLTKVDLSSDAGVVTRSALERGFDYFERMLSVEINLRLLTKLKILNADKYRPKYFQWQKIMLEVDETERLPELVDQGRFFLLMWHYFQLFADYHLESEPRVSEHGLDGPRMAEALREWQAGSRKVPDPVIYGGGRARLSGDFLRFGYALFYAKRDSASAQPLTEAEIEDGRQLFDEKAQSVISTLYQMLRGLPEIPKAVELIVQRHEAFVRSLLDA